MDKLAASPAQQKRITQWRGYPEDLIPWANKKGLIGLSTYYSTDREALLVEMPTPSLTTRKNEDTPLEQELVPVSTHIRLAPHTQGNDHPKQSWRFSPSGCGAWPFIIGDPTQAEYLFILEGQWDALALIGLMGWHHEKKWPASTAVIGLRGASSGNKLLTHYQLKDTRPPHSASQTQTPQALHGSLTHAESAPSTLRISPPPHHLTSPSF